jgi:hypothetical protein
MNLRPSVALHMRWKVYARRAAPAQRRAKLERLDEKRDDLERVNASGGERAVLDHRHGEINVIGPHQNLIVARNRCAPAIASGATFKRDGCSAKRRAACVSNRLPQKARHAPVVQLRRFAAGATRCVASNPSLAANVRQGGGSSKSA